MLLLGSATPRAESVHRVARSPLPRSASTGARCRAVEVLDMRGESARPAPGDARRRSRRVRAARGKAIVLLNRRGWSNFLSCRSCGRGVELPALRRRARAAPRAAAFSPATTAATASRRPQRCGTCASTSVARHGAGTERLQHELAAVLDDGGFPIFRLDADVAAGASAQSCASSAPDADGGARRELLRRFEAADCGVLIGTQMVAKGHDFPDVALGVVLDADATLRFPDFRAEERTFALIAQLAGRVGRGGEGRVLVQTIAPRGARDRARGRARQRRLPRGRARAPPRARLSAVLAPDQDRLLGRARRACTRGGAAPCAKRSLRRRDGEPAPARDRARARRRCFACAGASARCS